MKEEKKEKTLVEKVADKMKRGIYFCGICGEAITDYDIKGLNFEYIESKIGGKKYFHKACIRKGK